MVLPTFRVVGDGVAPWPAERTCTRDVFHRGITSRRVA